MDPVRRLLAAGACLAVLGGLAGCGEDPEPQFEADPSKTPSVAETPTASESAEPAPWEEKSPDGAVAFVEHWVETFSEAFRTGDTTQVSALAAEGCERCDGFVALIDDAYADGGNIEGRPWKVVASRPSGSPPEGMAAVAADIQQPAQVVNKSGQKPLRTPPGRVTYMFELTWAGGQWRVSNLAIEA